MEITRVVWVARFPIGPVLRNQIPLMAFLVFQTLEAPFLPQDIDVTLGENSAQPRRKLATPIEMVEEGDPPKRCLAAVAVECGVQGIGKFAGVRVTCGAPRNGTSCGVKIGAISGDEMLPGCFATFGTSAAQSKILEMKGAKVFFELRLRDATRGKTLSRALLERRRKPCERKTPPGCLRRLKEALEEIIASRQQAWPGAVARRDLAVFCVFGHDLEGNAIALDAS